MREEEWFSDACLTNGDWKNHLLLEVPNGSMLAAKALVLSHSVFCTVSGSLDSTSATTNNEMKAQAVMKSDNCMNRSDIAGDTI